MDVVKTKDRTEYLKKYREENKEHIKKYFKKYREENKEHIKKQNKKYREENKEHIKTQNKKWIEENKEHIINQNKKYYEKNKEYFKKYYEKNKEHIKKYREENKEHFKEYFKEYFKKYQQSEKGKIAKGKGKAKRCRNLGFELLFDNPFNGEPVDYHHISNGFVLPLPRDIHKSNLGRNHRQRLKPIIQELYNISYIVIENGKVIN